ncbi:MAG: Uncharacterized protein FD147_173 [Chloroflexi bacterium]|nr:MAG: Uncharacterized protein FD147_173 [Chloroflexota bacterium]MBA4374781.1 hypothetical protein [Anaerolinea sp.]
MSTNNHLHEMQTAIDQQLRMCVAGLLNDYPLEFISIFNYQLGWEGESCGKEAQGKRIRPLLVVLACQACGGDWRKSLPAAAAVELLHNFSLIHDDIQDRSETRRSRKTIWVKWGEAQAINAGDAMLALAQLSMFDLAAQYDTKLVFNAMEILHTACLKLTRGQYLDIAFEERDDLPMDIYWQMVEGKTSSLLSACFGLGALLGGAETRTIEMLMAFGNKVGMAFQVQDDWLGIWGDDQKTGKSAVSDLVTKKKTYPILVGIQKKGKFAKIWNKHKMISPEVAKSLASYLNSEGVSEETKLKFQQLYSEAFALLDSIGLNQEFASRLKGVIKDLLDRIK